MIEEKKVTMENAILLMKHIGCCKALKEAWSSGFEESSLNKRFENMIIEEDKKNVEKNEELLIDLCECYTSLNHHFPSKLISIYVTCLLKVALKKEENEETQKEVEMALLTLSCTKSSFLRQKLYLKEISEIIKYHREHRHLTQLANQSAWQFLIKRFNNDKSLEEVITNKLHFAREAKRELEGLIKCVDWKREKGEEKRKQKTKKSWFISMAPNVGNILFPLEIAE